MVAGHRLIVGQTGSGKSTLLKELAIPFRRSGIPVLAFTTVPHDLDGFASEVFSDVDAFMARVFAARRAAVYVDEAGEVVHVSKLQETATLATRSRHLGHTVFFSAQRAMGLIGPLVRDQCTRLFLFRVSRSDARIFADQWAADELLEAPTLAPGEFFIAGWDGVRRAKLDLCKFYSGQVGS